MRQKNIVVVVRGGGMSQLSLLKSHVFSLVGEDSCLDVVPEHVKTDWAGQDARGRRT